MKIESLIRDVPDWPKPGITFKDITPLLGHPGGLAMAVELMANPYRGTGIDLVAGAESRGFIFGTAIAQSLSAGFIPIRKPKKLPYKTAAIEYDLEYGKDTLEIHSDATGGTMKACCDLVSGLGGSIAGITVLIELTFLPGRQRLKTYGDLHAVIKY